MNRFRSLLILFTSSVVFLFVSCRSEQEESENQVRSVTPVTVCGIRKGTMVEYIELTATSSFQVKSQTESPVSGYIEKCLPAPGERVRKGQLLFQLRTKEGTALRSDSLDHTSISGLIRIMASSDGVISSIDHAVGDYVQEGDVLCKTFVPESLVFLLDLPYEYTSKLQTGNRVELLLPGKEILDASVRSVLPSMRPASQTQNVVLKPVKTVDVPEDLIARVRIIKEKRYNAVILPKSCILSDELMKEFWVMKLINDTLSVKLPVKIGISNTDSAEIVAPVMLPSDRFLNSGNYGLGDTARVRVIH